MATGPNSDLSRTSTGPNSEIRKILILSDLHIPFHNEAALATVESFMQDFQPHELIYLGDVLDMSAVNHHNFKNNDLRELEGKRLKDDYDVAKEIIQRHYELAGKPKIVWLAGNHESWLDRYIDSHPQLEGLLEIQRYFQFDFPIEWIEENHTYRTGKLYYLHGIWANKYHAYKHLSSFHRNIVYGHLHTLQCIAEVTPIEDDPHVAWSIPALADPSKLKYIKNKPTPGVTGFAVAYIDEETGNFNLYPIVIVRNSFIWNGKKYGVEDAGEGKEQDRQSD